MRCLISLRSSKIWVMFNRKNLKTKNIKEIYNQIEDQKNQKTKITRRAKANLFKMSLRMNKLALLKTNNFKVIFLIIQNLNIKEIQRRTQLTMVK